MDCCPSIISLPNREKTFAQQTFKNTHPHNYIQTVIAIGLCLETLINGVYRECGREIDTELISATNSTVSVFESYDGLSC